MKRTVRASLGVHVGLIGFCQHMREIQLDAPGPWQNLAQSVCGTISGTRAATSFDMLSGLLSSWGMSVYPEAPM